MNENSNIFLEVKALYNSLNDIDRKIADLILKSPNDIVYSTISDISDFLGISETSIFRFCKKLGYKGFQVFKITLASQLNDDKNRSKMSVGEVENLSIIDDVFLTSIGTLQDTLQYVDRNKIEKASTLIGNARRVLFCGNGGSGIVALDAEHKFIRIGLNVSAYTDSHMQLMAISQMDEQDVVVIISHTGTNLDMLNLIDIAKQNKTSTVAITSYANTPICKNVDIAINVISAETQHQFEAFASRIAHLTILDTIYLNVVALFEIDAKKSVNNMRKAISIKRM